MSRTVRIEEKVWRVSRQAPVTAGARATADYDVRSQEAGLWFQSDVGDARFLRMNTMEFLSEDELRTLPVDRFVALFQRAERRGTTT